MCSLIRLVELALQGCAEYSMKTLLVKKLTIPKLTKFNDSLARKSSMKNRFPRKHSILWGPLDLGWNSKYVSVFVCTSTHFHWKSSLIRSSDRAAANELVPFKTSAYLLSNDRSTLSSHLIVRRYRLHFAAKQIRRGLMVKHWNLINWTIFNLARKQTGEIDGSGEDAKKMLFLDFSRC